MLELTNHQCKLSNVNPRAETHGDKKVPACDLKFEANCPSTVLVHLHPELRQALFKTDEAPDLADQGNDDPLTALRFARLGGLNWEFEGTGYTLSVDYGLGGKSDIKLFDCKVDGLKFEPMNGGTVKLAFRVVAHPEADDMGRLYEMIQQDVQITLTPPAPATAAELFKDAA
jgi:hypothetical protein